MVMFLINFLNLTNPNSDALNDPKYHLTSTSIALNKSATSFNDLGDNIQKTLSSTKSPDPIGYLFLIFQGAFTIPWTFLGFVFNAIKSIGEIFLGLNSVMGTAFAIGVSAVITVLTITLVLHIIKSIRTGDSER